MQGELFNLLAELQQSFSLGILIVSHNLNVIGRVTDRVAIMYLGKIVEEGPTRPCSARRSIPTRMRCCRPIR